MIDPHLAQETITTTTAFLQSIDPGFSHVLAEATTWLQASAPSALEQGLQGDYMVQAAEAMGPRDELIRAFEEGLKALGVEVANEQKDLMESLGLDALVFLSTIVTIVPTMKLLGVSPILGFLGAGLLLGPSGLGFLRDLADLNAIGELGILFLLFEQGLELSSTRLNALKDFAFGLGLQQVVLTTIAFGLFPFLGGVAFLEVIFQSPEQLVSITRLDEAFVIGAALALSSSAFVLKILQEKGQTAAQFAKATLGVLLFQDLAIVPLLVLLPIIETEQLNLGNLQEQVALVGTGLLKSGVVLGLILGAGRSVLRMVFNFVAAAKSNETFVALVLLVAVGTGELTKAVGFSDTLGAFVAGLLLAETNFRTQIEADLAPFRGILLALFFLTTGASVDPGVIVNNLPTVSALLFGLIIFKAGILTALGPKFGLTLPESVKTGLLLSGGGEFAFVVLKLAESLEVLPVQLNKVLVGVVVVSMALTPALYSLGDWAEKFLEERLPGGEKAAALEAAQARPETYEGEDTVVICGFGTAGQVLGTYFANPEVAQLLKARVLAYDLNPMKVQRGRERGYTVQYGDGSQPKLLEAAKVEPGNCKAIVVTYSSPDAALGAVRRLRAEFPAVPIFALAKDFVTYWKLVDAGATRVITMMGEVSLGLGASVVQELGIQTFETDLVRRSLRNALGDLGREGKLDDTFNSGLMNSATWAAASGVAEEELGVSSCAVVYDDEDGGQGVAVKKAPEREAVPYWQSYSGECEEGLVPPGEKAAKKK